MTPPKRLPMMHGRLVPTPSGEQMRWCECCLRGHAPYFMCPAFDGLLRQAIINERNAFVFMLLKQGSPTEHPILHPKRKPAVL